MINKFLENEKIVLEEKITEARNNEKENTCKNLIQAYERVLELIRKENIWTDMYSHYQMKIDDDFQEVVSTWQQKDEDIREHKIYKIEKEITNDISMDDKTLNSIEDIVGYKIFAEPNKDSFGYILNDICGAWNHISDEQQIRIIKLLNGR